MGKNKKKSKSQDHDLVEVNSGNGKPLPKLVLKVGKEKPVEDGNVSASSEHSHHKKKKKKHKHNKEETSVGKSRKRDATECSESEPPAKRTHRVKDKNKKKEQKEPEISPLNLCLDNLHRTLLSKYSILDRASRSIFSFLIPFNKIKLTIRNKENTQYYHHEFIANIALHAATSRKDVYGIFTNPVTDLIAPGYSKIIKTPMDFHTMSKKIESNQYKIIEMFKDDYTVMCRNAMLYNGPNTIYYKSAEKMLAIGMKMMAKDKIKKMNKSIGIPVSDDEEDDLVQIDDSDVNVEFSAEETPSPKKKTPEKKSKREKSKNRNAIAASILAASREARQKLLAKHPKQKYGYLSTDKEGNTSMNVLNPDTTEEDQSVQVNLGDLAGRLKSGLPAGQIVFKENNKNKAIPMQYLFYGPFGSFGPSHDASLSNLTKDDSDTLLRTYGTEIGTIYAKSILRYVKDAPLAGEYVNKLLDTVTGGAHSKSKESPQNASTKSTEGENKTKNTPATDEATKTTQNNSTGKVAEENAKVDIESLLSLNGLGIDVGFLKSMSTNVTNGNDIADSSSNNIQEKLEENSTLLAELRDTQNDRLTKQGGKAPVPEEEMKIATSLTNNMKELLHMVKPQDVVSSEGIRSAIGNASSDQQTTTSSTSILDEERPAVTLIDDDENSQAAMQKKGTSRNVDVKNQTNGRNKRSVITLEERHFRVLHSSKLLLQYCLRKCVHFGICDVLLEKGTLQDVDVKNQNAYAYGYPICDVLQKKGTSQDADVKNQTNTTNKSVSYIYSLFTRCSMENFVLYDEISIGNDRVVYKGRRKGTIQYVAIHCIDKSKRSQIQNNVRICHELKHENIVAFNEWYETSNHLWLVVELCTGLSLRTILEQDSYLPENTVKSFSKDLVHGLAYLHSCDILYIDLQPKKVLLDGDGTLKLSNFSLARYLGEETEVLSMDASKDSLSNDALNEKRLNLYGSPSYMAPELLSGDLPSKSSDLWALGVVMYEMFTGVAPFKATTFEDLCRQIMEAQTPYPMQGQDGTFTKASENLFMLIQGLLQKEPSQRIDWLELCLHPFWDGELSELADSMDVHSSQTLSSRCVSTVNDERVVISRLDLEESLITDMQESFRRDIEGSFNTQTNVPDEKTVTESLTQDDTMNDEKEERNENFEFEKNSDRKGRPKTVPKIRDRNNLQTSSLQLPEEKEMVDILTSSVQSDIGEKKIAWQQQQRQGTYKLERGLAVMDLTEINNESNVQNTDSQNHIKSATYGKTRDRKHSVNQSKMTDINLDASISSAQMLGYSEVIPALRGIDLDIIDHLYHPTDLVVTPIADNPKIRKLPNLKWENSSLGFTPISIEKLQKISREELKGHIVQVICTYAQTKKPSTQDKTIVRQKMSILAYLNTVIRADEMANIMLAENLLKSLLTDLKTSSVFELKARIGRVLGVIASSATYIAPSYNMSEVFTIVTDQIKQNFRNTQIKQSFLPVLGELLFYAATQEESEEKQIPAWEPTGAVFTMINKCLEHSDDTISRLFAAKIIENVTSTTGRYCKKFLTNDIGLGLWNMFMHSTSDMDKLTASSALCRISMHSSTVLQHVCDRAGLKSFQAALYSGPLKSQQAFVTLFINLLSSPPHAKRIFQDQALIQKVMQHLESPSLILRGKYYLLISEMCVRSHDVMLLCCESRLITCIERDSKRILSGKEKKEELEYVHQCLTLLVNNLVAVLPKIVQGVLHILDVVSGRHHPNPAQVKQLKIHLPLVQSLLYMITSAMFRKRIVNENFVVIIGKLLEQVRKIDRGEINLSSNATRSLADNITSTTFSIVEAMTQHPPLLLNNQSEVIDHVVPVLATFNQSEDGNLRMLSLKLFSDISSLFLDNEGNDTARKDCVADEKLLKIMEEHFIPEFENLLQDQHPLPAYALKLLYSYTESNPKVIQVILQKNTISTLLQMLRSYQGDINSTILQSIVGILNNIVSTKDIDFIRLCKQGLIDYLSSAFIEVASSIEEDTNMNSISSLLLSLLDTLHHVLKNIELAVKSVLIDKSTIEKTYTKHDVEELLQDCKILSELNGILINLLVYDDVDIQKWACRCLYLSSELFGGEYEDCFSDDNLDCVCQFLQATSRKQQKLMLRILKRFLTSNVNLLSILKHKSLKKLLEDFKSINGGGNEEKSVRTLSSDLLKLAT